MSNFYPIQHILLDSLPVPATFLSSYKSLGLNEKEAMVIMQLHRIIYQGNFFPTPSELGAVLAMDEKECANILRKLIQKNLLAINQLENEKKQLTEAYSLEPLWNKLYNQDLPVEENFDGTLFILFEQEFGRPLSPFEIETINIWLDEDKISPALIKAGLRESVLMGKLNFKYIDRILREWKKKGIHTVEQARDVSRSFHNRPQFKTNSNPTTKRDTSFYYNWLEGEE